MRRITDDMIEYVGILAKLELTDDEKKQAQSDMEKMLDYIDILNEVDTNGVDIDINTVEYVNIFREDEVTNQDVSKEILKNAPEVRNGMFIVPKTI